MALYSISAFYVVLPYRLLCVASGFFALSQRDGRWYCICTQPCEGVRLCA